jgi:putative FmdB family regulatory protein
MPIYEYELTEGNCAVCGGKFTLRRPLSAKPLTNCPACKKPVRKILSTFSSPIKLKPLSVTDAKKAGFTVLKRVNKGEYERQWLGQEACSAKALFCRIFQIYSLLLPTHRYKKHCADVIDLASSGA